MTILGVDPGTASMGFGVIKIQEVEKRAVLKESGVIITKAGQEMHKRLAILYSNLNDVVKKFTPDILVVERLFFNTNAKTAMTVGQARGITMLIAAHNDLEVIEYTALQAKRTLSGYGRADKKEMQEAVRKILGLSTVIKSDDANDGVAMALCYFMMNF